MRKIINSDLSLKIEKRDNETFRSTLLDIMEQHAQREDSIDIIKVNIGNASVDAIRSFMNGLTGMLEKQGIDKNVIFVPVGENLPIKDIKISRVVVEEVGNVEENNREGKKETT